MFQKLYRHLEAINQNTQNQPQITGYSEETAKKMTGQLEAIHHSLESQKPYRLPPVFIGAVIFSACLSFIMLTVLIWQSTNISRTTTIALNRSAENARLATIALTRNGELEHSIVDLQVNAGHTDSLIAVQSRTILELQQLDRVAIQAFLSLKHNLDQQHQTAYSAVPKH